MGIDVTTFLSRLIGVYCLVMFLSMLKRDMMIEVFRELSSHRTLSYLLGVFMIFLGLFIVLAHTSLENLPSIIITLFGWLIVILAMVFLFSSKEAISRYIKKLDNTVVYYLITIGYFLLGAYLFCIGFFA